MSNTRKKQFNCKNCDKTWFDFLSNDKNKQFCSIKCKSSYSRIDRTCKQCKTTFSICKSVLKTNASGNFCSRYCYTKWLCQTDYIEGRGTQWRKIRNKIIQKTPFCVFCGNKEKLQVHHIIPFRITHDNGEDNLLPLCAKHHKKIETMTHDIELVEKDFERMKIMLKNLFFDRICYVKSICK